MVDLRQLIKLRWLILPHRVALITTLIALPLLLPLLLPSSFNTTDPMDSFVPVTSQSTRRGGSSHISSSRAAGKAPAVPQKHTSKASGSRKRKRLKTTANTIDLESLTYYKSESKSLPEPLPLLPLAAKPKQIKLYRQWYQQVNKIASQRRGKKRSSHIWGKGKGFVMVHETIGIKYYYCC